MKTKIIRRTVIIAAILVVIYCAAFGPIAAYCAKPGAPKMVMLHRLYTPVFWLHNWTPLRVPINAYVDLCGKYVPEPHAIPSKKPNQSPEPTTTAVTPRADARVAPAAVAAHL